MDVKYLVLCLVLIIGIAGCTVQTPTGTDCTPPAVKMLDVNGNPVCVLPEASAGQGANTVTGAVAGGNVGDNSSNANVSSAVNATGKSTVTKLEKVNQTVPVVVNSTAQKAENETNESTKTAAVEASASQANSELPKKIVTEGDLVDFPNLAATDPDGDKITYTFSSPLGKDGTWQTKIGDAGEYRATITASDGVNVVSQDVLIVVNQKNRPPVIAPISNLTVSEGDTVVLEPSVSDPDGDNVTIKYSGWMNSQSYQTNYNDAGDHVVTITASDGVNTVSTDVTIKVLNKNRPPVLAPISGVTVTEGDKVSIVPTATDPDGDNVTFKFSKPLENNGIWQTKRGDAGTYEVDVEANDGQSVATREFTLTVKSANQPPVITIQPQLIFDEGDTVVINPVVTDPEGDKVTVTYSGWMNSNTRKTSYSDAGNYTETITASDGINTVSKDVTIIIRDVNRAPEFNKNAFS